MILADTSIWIEHLRKNSKRLVTLLNNDLVLTHPFIIGELAAGNLKNRSEFLDLLRQLPQAIMVSHEETLDYVERNRLHGIGLGWIDLHLLAAAQLSKARVWSLDKTLTRQAEKMGLAF